MTGITDKESLAFWGVKLDNPKQPFKSLKRRQLLEQLKKQFGLNPMEWSYKFGNGEDHWHSGVGNDDRIEDESGYIISKKGIRRDIWLNWVASCDAKKKSSICQHRSPEECRIKFFVEQLGDTHYDQFGNLRNGKHFRNGKLVH